MWKPAMKFLRNCGVISPKDEAFITSLYTLVSDGAIHPRVTDRDYAQLLRNIVVEYSLLFLTTLQSQNATTSSPPAITGSSPASIPPESVLHNHNEDA
jgi:hypothetical protein